MQRVADLHALCDAARVPVLAAVVPDADTANIGIIPPGQVIPKGADVILISVLTARARRRLSVTTSTCIKALPPSRMACARMHACVRLKNCFS